MKSSTTETLDDLLDAFPELRKIRRIGASRLRKLLERCAGECTWCGGVVPKGRYRWCSTRCVDEYELRCVPSGQIEFVRKRDRGICQICGLDTYAAWKDFSTAWTAVKHLCDDRTVETQRRELMSQFGWGRGAWSEVDHILPVVEGGGLCSVDNLRLICGRCHAKETLLLSRRRKGK